ncbi:hypothetical protein QZH41_014592, partial [Actinostola sp. cb2023]
NALVEQMKMLPYSLATDGSNDNGLKKLNPLTVRIYDVNLGKVTTRFLDMCLSTGGTAEQLFTTIDDCLKLYHIPWENCVAVGVDNTNVNIGKNNSIMTRVKAKNDAVYFSGCQCHVVHNTSAATATALTSATGFDVEDLMVDVYYWFDYSTKRKSVLAEYTEFCDQDYRKILKHVSTRWLSLETAITRVLKQYVSLKAYFLPEDEAHLRFKRLSQAFRNPMTEVYLLFIQSALQIFLHLNLFLQKQEPLIGSVISSLKRFLRLLACKFVSPQSVKAASTFKELLDVQHHKEDSSVDIGFVTRTTLNRLVQFGDVSTYEVKKFYGGVKAFFCKAFDYGVHRMPVDDQLLQNAEFVHFEDRENMLFSMPQYFIQRYPSLLPFASAVEMEELSEEVNDFAMLDEKDIPSVVMEAAGKGDSKLSADVIWSHLNSMTRPDGQKRFPKLAKIALLVLTIPHSNAEEERVFSMIKKNKTSFRASLDQQETLGSIMTIKMEMLNRSATKGVFDLPPAVLREAKKATRLYNKAHSN